MEEVNFTQDEIKSLELFHKGGFESKIYVYNDELLIKYFELYIKWVLNFEYKKYKLIRLHEKKIHENILIYPEKLVNVDGEFSGYIMKKRNNGQTIADFYNYKKLISFYQKLFKKLEILHTNDIIVGDLKHNNIVIENNEPIFGDVDSMGVDEFQKDFLGFYSLVSKTIPNIKKKNKYNDETEIDKLKLLSCFIHSINRDNKNMDKKIINSKLSPTFKKEIINIFNKTKKINVSKNIHELFEEEIYKINR